MGEGSAPPSSSMIGRVINDYQVIEKLAEGGMGAVYLARHRLLVNTKKVVKILLPEHARNPVLRQRFEHEAIAVSRLQHDCILGIDGFGALDDGQLYLIIPFLVGQPLDAYLHTRGPLSPHRALHIIVQLCDALDHAHTKGIVHRDLKPHNVFVTRTNLNWASVKLLDFGLAKMVGGRGPAKTMSGMAMGTPAYMPVEQYEGAEQATSLSDVYSLGVMAWEMVTGKLPWGHHDAAIQYHLQKTTVPERPPESVMPREWVDILLRALSVDTMLRPQSVRELAVALASALPSQEKTPSGAEILMALAPHFVHTAAPSDETVRNVADADRAVPLLWPALETKSGEVQPQPLPPLNVATLSGTPVMPSAVDARLTAHDRPAGRAMRAVAVPATTLSALSGSVNAPSDARRPASPRWWRMSLAVGLSSLAAITTVLILSWVRGPAASSASAGELPRAMEETPPPDAMIAMPVPDAAPAPDAASVEAATRPADDVRRSAEPRPRPPKSGRRPNPTTRPPAGQSGRKFDPDAVAGD